MNATPAAIPFRKVQARFRQKLLRSFFVFKLLNFKFLFYKFIAAFWVGHLLFFVSKFCYSSYFGSVVTVEQSDFLLLLTIFTFCFSYFF